MYYIAAVLTVIAVAWGVAFFSPSPPLRLGSRSLVLLMALAALAGAGFCLIYPAFNSAAGVLIIPAMLLGLVTWLLFTVWSWLSQREDYLALSAGDRTAADKLMFTEGLEDIERRLARDRANVGRFWITPARRIRLRRQIAEQAGLLQGMKQMKHGYDEHQQRIDGAP